MLVDLSIDLNILEAFKKLCPEFKLTSEDPKLLNNKGFFKEGENIIYKEINKIKYEDKFEYFKNILYQEADKLGIDRISYLVDNHKRLKSQYGVADNIEQIKNYYKEEISNPYEKFAISVQYIYQDKSKSGLRGGWRWCKWGPYIGTLPRKCEYLDNEDFGDNFNGYVICFHLYPIK